MRSSVVAVLVALSGSGGVLSKALPSEGSDSKIECPADGEAKKGGLFAVGFCKGGFCADGIFDDHKIEGDPISVGDRVPFDIGDVAQIEKGVRYTAIRLKDGTVYTAGVTSHVTYQPICRKGDTANAAATFGQVFLPYNDGTKIVKIAAGADHLVLIGDNGRAYGCGYSIQSEDMSGAVPVATPTLISKFSRSGDVEQVKIVDAAAGERHTHFLTDNGVVWAAGNNMSKQLGLGPSYRDVKVVSSPTRVEGALAGKKIVEVSCGASHAIFRAESGEIYVVGENNHGQLGIGSKVDQDLPVQVTASEGKTAKKVVCGAITTFILWDDGSVVSAGWNTVGYLGRGTHSPMEAFDDVFLDEVGKVADLWSGTTSNSVFFKNTEGILFSNGRNTFYNLAVGDRKDVSFPQKTASITGAIQDIASSSFGTMFLVGMSSEASKECVANK